MVFGFLFTRHSLYPECIYTSKFFIDRNGVINCVMTKKYGSAKSLIISRELKCVHKKFDYLSVPVAGIPTQKMAPKTAQLSAITYPAEYCSNSSKTSPFPQTDP